MADDQDQGSGKDQDSQIEQPDVVDDQNPDEKKDDQDADGDQDEKVSKTDFDRLFTRMQAADRAKTAAEAKLREKEQAELSDLDRTKSQLEDEKKAREEAEGNLRRMVIENAFHRENRYSWHDVGDALAALDLSGVEIDDDGKVTGMAAAIKKVAKDKPHFVKSKEEGEGSGPPAANDATNGRRKGESSETLDRKKLVSRFPALGK